MHASQLCEFCKDQPLSTKPFYIFPCGHGMHCDCCKQKVEVYLQESEKVEIKRIEEKISMLMNINNNKSNLMIDKKLNAELECLQEELDNILASECPLCGRYMIHSIGISLLYGISENELKSWEI